MVGLRLNQLGATEALAYPVDKDFECLTVSCAECGERTPEYYTQELGGRMLCEDCLEHAYQAQSAWDMLGEKYVDQGAQRYLGASKRAHDDDLFYNWWLSGLEKPDRLRILRNAYMQERAAHGPAWYEDWEREFCTSSEDWKTFVSENIGGGA